MPPALFFFLKIALVIWGFYGFLWILGLFVPVVQLLSHVWLFVIPWTAAHQASLSFTISQSLLKLMSIESAMPSNHLILCRPILLPSIFPSIRVFSNESALCIRWPKYWSFSISLSKEYSGKSDFLSDLPVWSPCSPRDSHESSPTPQVKSISYTKCGMRLRRIPNRGRTCVLAVN